MKNTLIKLRPCISTTNQRSSLTSLMALFTSGFSEFLGMRSWFRSSHGVTRTGYHLLYPHTNLVLLGFCGSPTVWGTGVSQLEFS